jgi:hypothetical protein
MNKLLKKALKMCRDEDKLPDIIDFNYGVGLTFVNDDGHECLTTLAKEQNGRIMYVDIISYYSCDNGHYYGKIWFNPPYYYNKVENKTLRMCGRMPKLTPPEYQYGRIEIIREVTKEEIEKYPQRWDGYKAGDVTNAFNSKSELLDTIDFIIANRFTGDWVVRYT